VPHRKARPPDPVTGKKVFEPTGKTYINKEGKVVEKTTISTKLAETDDAFTLSSGTHIERVYAEHSNKLKALANEARKESIATNNTPYSPSAKAAYSNQVASLQSKLDLALKNAPLERQAQVIAGAQVSQMRQAHPNMDPADLKKIKYQTLEEARRRTDAKRHQIVPTEEEWNAIQAGAISNNKLEAILTHSDIEAIKKLATPKTELLMSPSKTAHANEMLALGYTQAEVAQHLGVSLTTLKTGIS
jgi:hypothetical protein